LAVKYLAGDRLIGTAAERAALTTTGSPPQTNWKELGRTTLGSNGTLTVSSFAAKDNLMILGYYKSVSGNVTSGLVLNSDTNNNYANRRSLNGGSDATRVNTDNLPCIQTDGAYGGSEWSFFVTIVKNISNKEKLCITDINPNSDVGIGTAPNREETVSKWANTAAQITTIQLTDGAGSTSQTWASGSEVVVLGCDDDEADSGTNFWQEIEKSPAYTSGTDLSSGTVHTNTFTAKKYLMVSVKTKSVGTNYANYKWRFNSDTGSNYAARYSDNGGSDGTSTSAANIMTRVGEVASGHALATAFIVNRSDTDKLGILHVVQGGATGAGTAPTRNEVVFKWGNTSSQITSMGGVSSSGSGTNLGELEIRIWGSN